MKANPMGSTLQPAPKKLRYLAATPVGHDARAEAELIKAATCKLAGEAGGRSLRHNLPARPWRHDRRVRSDSSGSSLHEPRCGSGSADFALGTAGPYDASSWQGRAFSSEVETGSRQENASNQESI